MGLDDFAPSGTKPVAKRALAPEDEDLFDFPVIEMTYEGDKASERRTIASVGTPAASTAPAAAAPVAVAPAATPAPAPAAKAPASIAPAATAKAAPAPAATAKAAAPVAVKTATKSAPAAQAPAKKKVAATPRDVQPAADLIDQLEEVLDERRDTQRAPRRGAKTSRLAIPLGAPRVLLGGMLMLNVLTFAFFWMVSQSFRGGIESLRDDLVLATRNAPIVSAPPSVQAAPVTPHEPAPVATEPKPAHAEPAHAEVKTAAPAHPLDAFEQTTLTLAAKEIDAHEFIAARKRLSRLLALADRMDATLKADIEARARFLVAESYRAQGEAKEEHTEATLHANEAAARLSTPAKAPAHAGKEH